MNADQQKEERKQSLEKQWSIGRFIYSWSNYKKKKVSTAEVCATHALPIHMKNAHGILVRMSQRLEERYLNAVIISANVFRLTVITRQTKETN